MLLKFIKRTLGFLGIATATLATPQAAAANAQPALWEVSDPDTTIYLFGTIHLLPEDYAWKTPALDKAIANSDSLVVETIIDPENPQDLVVALTRLGYSQGLPPLAERIDPAKRPLLETAIAKTGIPPAIFDRMETWTAAFTLLGVQFKEIGLKGEHGVEQALRDAFGAAGKPVGQLETNVEQLGFFDTLPESAQRSLLEGTLESPAEVSEEFSEMLSGWVSGDVDAIGETFNRGLSGSPELREALLKRRNANWSRWIGGRLAQPGVVLVAVGAGHLAGPDSVQEMLESEGYEVRRIQ